MTGTVAKHQWIYNEIQTGMLPREINLDGGVRRQNDGNRGC